MAGNNNLRTRFEALLSEVDQYDARGQSMTPSPDSPQILSGGSQAPKRKILATLSQNLAARLDVTLATFRMWEPILGMRRTSFTLTLVYSCALHFTSLTVFQPYTATNSYARTQSFLDRQREDCAESGSMANRIQRYVTSLARHLGYRLCGKCKSHQSAG